jgi:hypothetical protein
MEDKRSERSSESRAELVNEELREYEGFPAILSLLERTATDLEGPPQPKPLGLDPVRAVMMPTTDEERAAQAAVIRAINDRPEIADLVQRLQALLQDVDEARRAQIMSALFSSPETASSEQE